MDTNDAMFERRFGLFHVSREMVNRHPELVREFLADFLIVNCRLDVVTDCFEYTALSPFFKKVHLGCEPPIYNVIITTDEKNPEILEMAIEVEGKYV